MQDHRLRWCSLLATVVAALVAATVAGCEASEYSDAGSSAAEESDSWASDPGSVPTGGPGIDAHAFVGTAREYTVQLRACLEDRGLVTDDPAPGEDPLSFAISLENVTTEDYFAISEDCSQQIGTPYYPGIPEDELRRRYEARVVQFDCFKEHGWLTGDPMSYELFIADFERSGFRSMWVAGFDIPEGTRFEGSPGDVCPLGSL